MDDFLTSRASNGAFNVGISILLPTYNHPAGVEKILSLLSTVCSLNFEIIISDDSTDDRVRSVYLDFEHKFKVGQIQYYRNLPALGAALNWNHLLRLASKDYFQLLHHDENYFNASHFIEILQTLNQQTSSVDVFVLEVMVAFKNGLLLKNNPIWLKKRVLHNISTQFQIRNVFGPTSALIIKKHLNQVTFDANLRWLIDVDYYNRLFNKTTCVTHMRGCWIESDSTRSGSITATISKDIKQIFQQEKSYLIRKYSCFQFRNCSDTSAKSSILFKPFVWSVFRVCWYTKEFLLFRKYLNRSPLAS